MEKERTFSSEELNEKIESVLFGIKEEKLGSEKRHMGKYRIAIVGLGATGTVLAAALLRKNPESDPETTRRQILGEIAKALPSLADELEVSGD